MATNKGHHSGYWLYAKTKGQGRRVTAKWRALQFSTVRPEPVYTALTSTGTRFTQCPPANADYCVLNTAPGFAGRGLLPWE